MTSLNIIIATPHARGDALEEQVRTRLSPCRVTRIRRQDELVANRLEEISPDWVFFPHWSWIIPPAIHERFRCVVFHMTDLPFGRGGSPLQNLIARGHKSTMLCALQCIAQLDAGPVYMRRPLSLEGTAEEILQRASHLTSEMICDIVRYEPPALEQQGIPVVFDRRSPESGNLTNADGLTQVFDYIRMLDGEGYPRAFLEIGSLRLEFCDASIEDDRVTARVQILKRAPYEI